MLFTNNINAHAILHLKISLQEYFCIGSFLLKMYRMHSKGLERHPLKC